MDFANVLVDTEKPVEEPSQKLAPSGVSVHDQEPADEETLIVEEDEGSANKERQVKSKPYCMTRNVSVSLERAVVFYPGPVDEGKQEKIPGKYSVK